MKISGSSFLRPVGQPAFASVALGRSATDILALAFFHRSGGNTVLRAGTMTGDGAKRMNSSAAFASLAGILTGDTTDGLSLGSTVTAADVNTAGATIHYLTIFDTGDDDVATGTYVGNPSALVAARTIALPFDDTPSTIWILGEGTRLPVFWTESMGLGDSALDNSGSNSALRTNYITSKAPGQFVVGTNNGVQALGETFHWVALKRNSLNWSIGAWGGFQPAQTISGLSWTPEGALVKALATTSGVLRYPSMADPTTGMLSSAADISDGVTAFPLGSLVLSANAAVNADGVTYHDWIFRTGRTNAVSEGPGTEQPGGVYRLKTPTRKVGLAGHLGGLTLKTTLRRKDGSATVDPVAPDFASGPTTGAPTTTGWTITFTPDKLGTYQAWRYLVSAGRSSAEQIGSGAMAAGVAVSVGSSVASGASDADYAYWVVLVNASAYSRTSADIPVTVPGTGVGPVDDPPVINSVTVGTPTASGVAVTVATNEGCSIIVSVAPTITWPSGASTFPATPDATLYTSRTITCGNLVSGTPYTGRATVLDSGGHTVLSDTFTFTTATVVVTGSLTQMTPGTTEVHATMKHIGVVMPFTGDDNGDATMTCRFRTADVGAGAGTWKTALPFRRNLDLTSMASSGRESNGERRFMGSLIEADPAPLASDTTYDLELTVTDGSEQRVETLQATTRADNLGSAYDWTPTHYVNGSGYASGGWAAGDDLANGTGKATPWRTWSKAVAAYHADATITDMRVEFAPGPVTSPLPQPPISARAGKTIQMRAQYPAIGTDMHELHAQATPPTRSGTGSGTGRSIINDGLRTRVELRSPVDAGPSLSAPTGTVAPELALGYQWTEVVSSGSGVVWSQSGTLNNRTTIVPRIGAWKRADGSEAPLPPADTNGVVWTDLWVWQDGPIASDSSLGTARWSATRDGAPFMVGTWKHASGNIPNLPRFLKEVHSDPRYRYGMYKPRVEATAAAKMNGTPDRKADGKLSGVYVNTPTTLASVAMTDVGYYELAPTSVSFTGGQATSDADGNPVVTPVPTQATGHVVWDSARRCVTGVVVDTPGANYTKAPTIDFIRDGVSVNPTRNATGGPAATGTPLTGDVLSRDIYWLPAPDRLGNAILPNSVWVNVATQSTSAAAGIRIESPDTRLTGFEWNTTGQYCTIIENGAKRLIIDRNLYGAGQVCIFHESASNSPTLAAMATDVVIQHNRFVDTGLYDLELTPTHPGVSAHITWLFIKNQETVKAGQNMESRGIDWTEAARQLTIRWNTADGIWDFCGGKSGNSNEFGRDIDIYENYGQCHGDDFMDLAWNEVNFRAWGNRVMFSTVFLSNTPHSTHPQAGYVWRNVCLQDPTGQAPIPFSYTIPAGSPNAGTFRPAGWINRGAIIKMGGGAVRSPHWYLLYNTFVSNRSVRRGAGITYDKDFNPSAWGEEGGPTSITMPIFDNYGNIVHAGRMVVREMADYSNSDSPRTYPGPWAPWNSRKNNYSTNMYTYEPITGSSKPAYEFGAAPQGFTVAQYKAEMAKYANPYSIGTGSDDNPAGELTVDGRTYMVDPYETGTLDFRLKSGTNPFVGAAPNGRDLGYVDRTP